MFSFFEKQLSAFPGDGPSVPPEGVVAFVWACTQGVRGKAAMMAVLTAIMAASETLLFAMLGRILDWLGTLPPSRLWAERGGSLLWLAALLGTSIAVVALQTLVKHQTLAVKLPMRLRWNFHRLMLCQSMAFYHDEFAGRISARVMQTAMAVREIVFVLADALVTMSVYVTAIIVMVGALEVQLAWPFVSWLVLYIVSLLYFVPRLAKAGKTQAGARALMTGRVTDAYANISTVKLFSHTKREANFAREAMREFMHAGQREMRLVSAFDIVNHLLSVCLIASATGVALWLWSHGSVGVGAVGAAVAMALRLHGTSHWLMWEMTGLFENIGIVQDGVKTLSRPRTVVDTDNAAVLHVPRGEVRFQRVSFRYPGTDRCVVDRLDLTVKPGEKIGLVGRSGAGKSTLANLLLRFYDLESGRILIDGQDIATVTQESLRSQIGIVAQDAALMHRSVFDNISYGRPDATPAEVEAAALQAEAHAFIQCLKDARGRIGYEAHVGERGVKLSGGQRQRIAIARVMLKDAPILLLDEATSALDSEAELVIQKSLYRLMKGKTVIAIAHRLSTIAAMDRLVVFDQGRMIEQGDHATLLAKDGLYARLWAHQSGGFLGTTPDDDVRSAVDAGQFEDTDLGSVGAEVDQRRQINALPTDNAS